MLVDLLFKVSLDPSRFLGRRSLYGLSAFEQGFTHARMAKMYSIAIEPLLREWLMLLYRPRQFSEAKSIFQLLNEFAPSYEEAFDLFFRHLEAVLAANPDVLKNPTLVEARVSSVELPLSASVDALASRPIYFLPKLSIECLRAFLDGARFAYSEEGRDHCADLDGFERYIHQQLSTQGFPRWETAVLNSCGGNERAAFDYAIDRLRAFRDTLGLNKEQKFAIVLLE